MSNSTVVLRLIGSITGLPEGGSQDFSMTMSNSTGTYVGQDFTAATAQASGTSVNVPTGAKFMILVPPSTNTTPFRLAPSTASSGIGFSSRNFSVLAVGSTVYTLWTTGTTAFPVRVVFC